MQKQALGNKITSAYKTVAGKAKEIGQRVNIGRSQHKINKVPYMFKRATDIKSFTREKLAK